MPISFDFSPPTLTAEQPGGDIMTATKTRKYQKINVFRRLFQRTARPSTRQGQAIASDGGCLCGFVALWLKKSESIIGVHRLLLELP